MGQRSGARRPSCPVKRQLRRRTGRSLSSRNPAKRRARPRWRLLLRTQYLLHFSHFHTAERTPNIGSRPFNAADITTPAIKRTPDRGIAEQKEPKRHAYFRNCPPATFGSRIVRKSGATKRGRRGYIRHFGPFWQSRSLRFVRARVGTNHGYGNRVGSLGYTKPGWPAALALPGWLGWLAARLAGLSLGWPRCLASWLADWLARCVAACVPARPAARLDGQPDCHACL